MRTFAICSMLLPSLSNLPIGPILRFFIPSLGMIIGARSFTKLGFVFGRNPASSKSLKTFLAMLGEPASPGLSMPATCMKCGFTFEGSIIQSPRSLLALAPQKAWNVSLGSKQLTRFLHFDRIYSCTAADDMSLASALYTSLAVGPRIRLPHKVVWTSTPLPRMGSGQGKSVWLAKDP